MSKYESEHGSIVIPTDQWVAFRKGIIEAHNAEQERLFALATSVLARVKAEAKGKRGFDYAEAIRRATRSLTTERSDYNRDEHEISGLLGMNAKQVDGKWVEAKKPSSPKRKDLDIRPTSRGGERIDADEGSIKLVDETHTVHWSVSENNHACDTARSHPVGRALFRALGKVEWKRGSGGKIIGNDEYNREADGEGAGGNYVTGDYGSHVPKAPAITQFSYGYSGGRYGGGRW